jgi:hypothetical protein
MGKNQANHRCNKSCDPATAQNESCCQGSISGDCPGAVEEGQDGGEKGALVRPCGRVTTRQKAVICAVPIVALISVLIMMIIAHPREPYYEGQPFTYWLDQIVCTQVFTNGGFSELYPDSYVTFAQTAKNRGNSFQRTEKATKVVAEMGGE